MWSSTALVVCAICSFLMIEMGHSDFQLELGIFEIQCLTDPTIRPVSVFSDHLHIIILFGFCIQDSHLSLLISVSFTRTNLCGVGKFKIVVAQILEWVGLGHH